MRVTDELIQELSNLCGIVPEYWDIFGGRHETSNETRRSIISAMGIDPDSSKAVKREIERRSHRPWNEFIEPVTVISVNAQPLTFSVYLPLSAAVQSTLAVAWSIEDESGLRESSIICGGNLKEAGEKWINGVRYVKIDVTDRGGRELGYYSLSVTALHPEPVLPGGKNLLHKTARVIVTPDSCFIPPALERGRTWGLAVNLYALRSGRNYGAGDLGDLRQLVAWVAGLKAGFVGLNPLHAIPNKGPFGMSPYSPISRLYCNFIYIDLEQAPGYGESGHARHMFESGEFKAALNKLRASELIDYKKVARLKKKALKALFEDFHKGPYSEGSALGREFQDYMEGEGEALRNFAVYCALWEHMNETRKVYSWQDWPEEYQDHAGQAVAAFAESHAHEVLFHQYAQWVLHRQLREIGALAEDLGMPVGIYNDLAIGSIGGGSDAWCFRDVMAFGADVGAPPDDFNPKGQNWGFPPLDPDKLRESGYEFFINTMRKNMQAGGALRIDHALGLFRLFWIPCGLPAAKGAYVTFPHDDLLRIIALESVRNRTMVIAEDLGTIGDNVPETLNRFCMLSYRLLYFERNYPDPSFKRPSQYPGMSLCAVTTHDLPTLSGYWQGRDIELKKRLGVYHKPEMADMEAAARKRDLELLVQALESEGIMKAGAAPVMTPGLCAAIYRYLSMTPSKLLAVSLDDALSAPDQQNMPGVTEGYPSWLQKTEKDLNDIMNNPVFPLLASAFKETGRTA